MGGIKVFDERGEEGSFWTDAPLDKVSSELKGMSHYLQIYWVLENQK